jgi:hypothetical protein
MGTRLSSFGVLMPEVQGKVIDGSLPEGVTQITVPPGTCLHLKGCILCLPPGVSMVVEHRAKLVMENVTLTGSLDVKGSVTLQRCRVTSTVRSTSGSSSGSTTPHQRPSSSTAAVHVRDGGQGTIIACKLSSVHGPGLLVEHAGSFCFARDSKFLNCGGSGVTVIGGASVHTVGCISSSNEGNGSSAGGTGSTLEVRACTAEGNTGRDAEKIGKMIC